MSNHVKLNMYRHESTETIIESFQAKDWGDFLIVTLDTDQVQPEVYQQIAEVFRQYSAQMNKEVILVPKAWDFEFYGVEVEDASIEANDQ